MKAVNTLLIKYFEEDPLLDLKQYPIPVTEVVILNVLIDDILLEAVLYTVESLFF